MSEINRQTLELFSDIKTDKKRTKKRPKKRSKIPKADKAAVNAWNECREIISDNINNEQVFKTWFEPIDVMKLEENMLTLMVPSQFFFEWIEEHYYDLMQKTIRQVIGEKAKIQYEVVVDDSDDSLKSRTIKIPGLKYPPSVNQEGLQFDGKKEEKPFNTNLNPRYVFENFITGDSNQLACSAAEAVSKSPGKTRFNPLLVYGSTGLGKTHLVQAIGNYCLQNHPESRVLYTDSDRFTHEFVNAIKNNKADEFISFYRSIDVLLMDDIQFFEGKDKTQDNFFHTFNALHQAGKQIVLTSDRSPKEIKGVDDRLISRFQWGLTVDVQIPDYEMRMAILEKKSMDEGIELPYEIIDYIARNVQSNIREIEGTLIGVIAKITLDGKPYTVETAREVVQGVNRIEKRPLGPQDIKEIVSSYYSIRPEELESKSRKHEFVLARQMAMYLTKQMTELSLKAIGTQFGGRDHTTVMHSCTVIENYFTTNNEVKKAYRDLFNNISDRM